jgi:CheY-like chemotaxis protein
MKKILVVDDDATQHDFYVQFFKQKGLTVIEAEDGLAGLELALKEKPDVVFTGIIMPRMDGFEFIRNLRTNAVTAKTPVIMFSHLGREEDRAKANKLSDVTFMIKGMDGPKVIFEKVEEYIGKV